VLLAFALLLVNYASQTDWVPQLVDAARNLPFVGPERVAALENLFYTAEDAWNQFIYDHTHSPIVVAPGPGANSNLTRAPNLNTPSPRVTPTSSGGSTRLATPGPAAPITSTTAIVYEAPSPLTPNILSDSQVGEGVWTTRNMPLGDQSKPPLWHTFYRPDPDRPYARVDLVWIDLSQTELTLVQGTVEPRPVDGIRGTGQIPLAVQSSGKLLAAWNGGFLTLHGAYGMMVDRRIIAPPRDGFAVLAQYTDGHMRLGVWGRDVTMTPDLVSFRQNGPILIDHGMVNQDAFLNWGKSVSGETRIWRSGIGLTANGELIFGVGDALSAQTLGEALRQAGAVEAMQLDVNSWHVSFYTYALTPMGLVPTKLNAAIPGSLQTYLRPYDRDFMYLTLK
jgi:phosphodiester glycosidase